MFNVDALKDNYTPVKRVLKEREVNTRISANDNHETIKTILKTTLKTASIPMLLKTASVLLPFSLVSLPVYANGFENLHKAIMTGFDYGVVIVIIFAGAAWSLGHRSKAIEILIGVCCGYLLARYAVPIRDFLKGI